MATKKTKSIASEQMKQPRAKTKADEIYNARRRAKRAADKLKRDIASGKITNEAKTAAQNLISDINETVKMSYAKRTKGEGYKYRSNIESIVSSLDLSREIVSEDVSKYAPKRVQQGEMEQTVLSQGEIRRKDAIWKRNLNQATKKGGVSPIEEQEARMFFRVTQRFWNVDNVSMETRLQKIVEGLGVRTIEEAFNLVVNNKDVRKVLDKLGDISDGSGDEWDDRYKYVERLINKIEMIYSMQGNPFTESNLISNET